uniref:Uncharacterized protein n=1 Tax=Arundo donax TaxID=35708 RepID=A0A0A9A2R7_ARUDO
MVHNLCLSNIYMQQDSTMHILLQIVPLNSTKFALNSTVHSCTKNLPINLNIEIRAGHPIVALTASCIAYIPGCHCCL